MKKLLTASVVLSLIGCDGGSSLDTSVSVRDSVTMDTTDTTDETFQIPIFITVTQSSRNLRNIEISWLEVPETASVKLCEIDITQEGECGLIKERTAADSPVVLQLGTEVTLEQLLNNQIFLQFEDPSLPNLVYQDTLNFTSEIINDLIQYIKPSNTDNRDEFGFSIAISEDGKILAINSRYEDSQTNGEDAANKNSSGAVYVFVDGEDGWLQQAFLKHPFPDQDDEFGKYISMSADGSTIAISVPGDDSDDQDSLDFEEMHIPTDSATGVNSNGDSFTGRRSILIETTETTVTKTAIITQAGVDNIIDSITNSKDTGSIYIYTQNGDTWDYSTIIKSKTMSANMYFGTNPMTLSSDGKTLAVGHYSGIEESIEAKNERVEIFTNTGTEWVYLQTLEPDTVEEGDFFGFSLALSNDANMLAVAAVSADSNSATNPNNNALENTGSVYLFKNDGSTYSQVQYLKGSSVTSEQEFGSSIGLSSSGDILAVGAPGSETVFIFYYENDMWLERYFVTPSNTDAREQYGNNVAISDDGSKLIVSTTDNYNAQGINGTQLSTGYSDVGGVYVYDLTNSSATELAYLKPIVVNNSFTMFGSSFGTDEAGNKDGSSNFNSIEINGNGTVIVVGSPGDDSDAIGVNNDPDSNKVTDSGAAYIFYF